MVEKFLGEYKSLKSRWNHIIDDASKGVMQKALNQIIWIQHVQSFENSEWGELCDFNGLQENILLEGQKKYNEVINELPQIIESLEIVLNLLEENINTLGNTNPLLSASEDKMEDYMRQLFTAYDTELKLRKKIVTYLQSCDVLFVPYDIVVTLSSMWSGKLYTNDRMIGHIEKMFDFEVSALKALILSKQR